MIEYRVDDDGVCVLSWNVPDRPVNVLNVATMTAFIEAVEQALADELVRGVVVASAKGDFIAGADLDTFILDPGAEELMAEFGLMDRVTRRMETGGKPFCAAINGHALGGGFEVALGCHRRIAADNPKTQVGLPEVSLGLLPGGGGTQRVGRMLGIEKAAPLLVEGRRMGVRKALETGLIDEVVPAGGLIDAARTWVLANPDATQPWDRKGFTPPGPAPQSMPGLRFFMGAVAAARQKTYGNYPAPVAILSCLYEGMQIDFDAALRMESRYLTQLVMDRRTKNMIRTGFFAMNDAKKLKARPAGVPKTDYTRVGILGAGLMGAGIAQVTAQAGIEAILLDVDAATAARGRDRVAQALSGRVERGRMAEADAAALLGRIRPTADHDDLSGCELIIEAVTENRAIKAEVTRAAETRLAADGILASNTSTLPITGLAEVTADPARFVGLHFFSPVDRMPLVEVIRGEKTGDEALAKALDYVKAIGKTPVVVGDGRGFFTSRVFAVYILEAFAMVGEGVKAALVENAARIAGMPIGPLELQDAANLGLILHILDQARADLGDAYVEHPGEAVVRRMVVDLGRSGRQAGKGFYDYPEGGPKRLWPGLAEQFPPLDPQPDVEEVKRRLLHVQAVEAARALSEGVVASRADADVASILGWAFPAWTGGVASYVDLVGVDRFRAECEALADRHGDRFRPPAGLGTRTAA